MIAYIANIYLKMLVVSALVCHTAPMSPSLHRRLNLGLSVVATVLGLYIVAAPFMPQIGWRLSPHKNVQAKQAIADKQPISGKSLLIIPRLDMREEIHSGTSITELNKGVWLRPHTSQPDLPGNTVMVGHRFTYAGPAVFYFLDKLQLNDRIIVTWQHKAYTYQVTSIRVVPPTEVSVEEPTPHQQLTLYTCTPLWTAKDRLVITADLQGVRS